MCNQTVCLVAAELERRGIATVVIQLLRMVAEKVRPPRALCVPYPHGYPLGRENDPEQQRRVMTAALGLLHEGGVAPPLLADLPG
jgi:hypothetical protein